MKNYLILAMILIAGMTAYPQATRSARESKSEKGSSRKESVQKSSTRSESKSGSERSVNKSSAERTRPEAARTRVETRNSERPAVNRSNNEVSRTRIESGRTDRSGQEATQKAGVQTRTRTSTDQRTYQGGNAERKVQTTVTRPENRSTESRGTVKESRNDNDRDVKVNSSSASRVYREGKGTLTRDDGTVIRHQNDDVFRSKKYKLDYNNYENLRRSDEFRRDYRDYDNWYNHRHIRVINHYNTRYIPVPYEVRRSRYYYRAPHHISLIWTPLLFHRFMYYYPTHNNWEMEFGQEIETISAYEAQEYAGTVRRVYGKVDDVYYSPEDETYILYIGAQFPYQDLSVVIPKHIARNLTASPKWYFENEFVWVVGLINIWDGKPEIIVRDEDQIRKY